MPVSFSRLRIAGFKSFAEPANVEIRPGLTGIVGPNGCGKSNVVEALRWAMGENSRAQPARRRDGRRDLRRHRGPPGAQHRRGDADAGRHRRRRAAAVPRAAGTGDHAPHRARHAAARTASTAARRGRATCRPCSPIWRRARTARRWSARAASARWSTARPEERRMLLEEAAGITGLHARRHEAELKLRAAEANLTRAEDLRGQLEAQLGGLKRQARQASRYRNISGAIRGAEAELLAIQRARAERRSRRGPGRAARRRRWRSPPPPAPPPRRRRAPPTARRRCPRCARPRPTRAPRWNGTASRRSRSSPRKPAPATRWRRRRAGWRSWPATWPTPSSFAATPRRRRRGWPTRTQRWPRPRPAHARKAETLPRRRPRRPPRRCGCAEAEANRATEAAADGHGARPVGRPDAGARPSSAPAGSASELGRLCAEHDPAGGRGGRRPPRWTRRRPSRPPTEATLATASCRAGAGRAGPRRRADAR